MSKKDNLKFKKRIKSQILETISHAEENKLPTPAKPNKVFDTSRSATKPAENSKENNPPSGQDNNLKLVKVDLKKSAFIISSIIILIFAIYIVDHKTGFLLKAGSSLFKFLHISA